MGRSPEARHLAELLCSVAPEKRRALIALATDAALQLGVLKAGLEHWPDEVPKGEARDPEQPRREA